MEGSMLVFYGFVVIVGLVFGVLQIILFFKLWGMTNNVTRLLKLLEKQTGLNWFPDLKLHDELGIYRTKREIETTKRRQSDERRKRNERFKKRQEERVRQQEEKEAADGEAQP